MWDSTGGKIVEDGKDGKVARPVLPVLF